ncbi:hypothetical protein EDD15DRAFT_2199902 [Pisolithus albus]|nr:hypothetical protein EDD15DRAFT_2199902 [Pisolithus albus]
MSGHVFVYSPSVGKVRFSHLSKPRCQIERHAFDYLLCSWTRWYLGIYMLLAINGGISLRARQHKMVVMRLEGPEREFLTGRAQALRPTIIATSPLPPPHAKRDHLFLLWIMRYTGDPFRDGIRFPSKAESDCSDRSQELDTHNVSNPKPLPNNGELMVIKYWPEIKT